MIIILHGALGSRHQFDALLERCGSSARFIEFPGHGSTADQEAPWSIAAFADHVAIELEQIGGRARIFGYSMGGYVAMCLAMQRPDLVSRILTVGTKLAWTPATAAHEATRLDPEAILAKVPQFATDLMRRHGADRWKTVLSNTASLMRELGRTPLLTPERVATLEQPVRLCVGDRDAMVSIDETAAIAKALPHGQLAVLPGTRHPMEQLDLQQLMFHVTTWLDSDDAA
jgi:pimeloyl-ACP methyl ester carboxylesterase